MLLIGAVIYYFVVGFIVMELDLEVNTAIFVLGYVVIAVVIFTLRKGARTKCPHCGKLFAMREVERKSIGSYATTKDIEQNIKNNKGQVTGSYTQTVAATAYVHACIDECKYCQYRREVKRESVYRD